MDRSELARRLIVATVNAKEAKEAHDAAYERVVTANQALLAAQQEFHSQYDARVTEPVLLKVTDYSGVLLRPGCFPVAIDLTRA